MRQMSAGRQRQPWASAAPRPGEVCGSRQTRAWALCKEQIPAEKQERAGWRDRVAIRMCRSLILSSNWRGGECPGSNSDGALSAWKHVGDGKEPSRPKVLLDFWFCTYSDLNSSSHSKRTSGAVPKCKYRRKTMCVGCRIRGSFQWRAEGIQWPVQGHLQRRGRITLKWPTKGGPGSVPVTFLLLLMQLGHRFQIRSCPKGHDLMGPHTLCERLWFLPQENHSGGLYETGWRPDPFQFLRLRCPLWDSYLIHIHI